MAGLAVPHSLEQAEDEGVEAHGVAGELRKLADFVAEAVQGLGGRAWEEARAAGHMPISGTRDSAWGPHRAPSSYLAVWKPQPHSMACSYAAQ